MLAFHTQAGYTLTSCEGFDIMSLIMALSEVSNLALNNNI